MTLTPSQHDTINHLGDLHAKLEAMDSADHSSSPDPRDRIRRAWYHGVLVGFIVGCMAGVVIYLLT
jgi:hypothetical protein